jgi:hypothetical protein
MCLICFLWAPTLTEAQIIRDDTHFHRLSQTFSRSRTFSCSRTKTLFVANIFLFADKNTVRGEHFFARGQKHCSWRTLFWHEHAFCSLFVAHPLCTLLFWMNLMSSDSNFVTWITKWKIFPFTRFCAFIKKKTTEQLLQKCTDCLCTYATLFCSMIGWHVTIFE